MKASRWLAATALTVLPICSVHAQSAAPDNATLAKRVEALEATVAALQAQLAARDATPTQAAARVPSAAAGGAQPGQGALADKGAVSPSPAQTASTGSPSARTDGQYAFTAASTGVAKREEGFRIGSQIFKLGGYLKVQGSYSRYSAGNAASSSILRESLIPGNIPIGGAPSDETHFDARQTRLWLTSSGNILGHSVGSRVEVDFVNGDIDDRTTNGTGLRLRRAYVTVDNWLFGQEWTNFQDIRAFPESAELNGPSAGTLLVRQAQLRYTRGPLSISIENPETTYSPYRQTSRVVPSDNTMPDVTARYDIGRGKDGFLSIAGLFRQLRSDAPGLHSTTWGWALSASGKLQTFGKDDIRFQINGGHGLGRYMLNFANDAGMDAQGNLHALPQLGGFVAYRHFWTGSLRSSFIFDGQRIFNSDDWSAPGANRAAISGEANLVWSPITDLDLGTQIMHQERHLQDGEHAHVERVITYAKFGF